MAGRPKGVKAHDYDEKRADLIRRLRTLCFERPTERLSVRQMASGVGVSVPTLKNYFADRDAIIGAVLEQCWRDAAALLTVEIVPDETLQQRVKSELDKLLLGLTKFGLDKLHIWGMNEGLASAVVGPAYLNYFLEPTLQAAEKWLSYHQGEGAFSDDINIRHAAISLYAPCLVLVTHQSYLGGDEVRRADLARFFDEHSRRFIGYLNPQPAEDA